MGVGSGEGAVPIKLNQYVIIGFIPKSWVKHKVHGENLMSSPDGTGRHYTFAAIYTLMIIELRDHIAVTPRSSDMGCYLLYLTDRALQKHCLLEICVSVLFHR